MHYTERPDQRRTNKYRANRTGARPATVSDGTPGVYIRVHRSFTVLTETEAVNLSNQIIDALETAGTDTK